MVKCYITLSDFESAKIHIESAILMARKFNMKDILSRLYILYGKYFQEAGLVKSPRQTEYLQSSAKLYKEAKSLIEETQNKHVYQDLKKAKSVLKSFCHLHNLDIGEQYD